MPHFAEDTWMYPLVSNLPARVLGRLKRASTRARERIEGLPLRRKYRDSGVPIPPGRLLHQLANTERVSWFLESGALAVRALRETLERHVIAFERLTSVLDFGCASGRVLRHFRDVRGPIFYGCDTNAGQIAWCRAHLPFARFEVNGLSTPLAVDDARFDVIYALSVFTHLPEGLQQFWIQELTRVLRPGGHLYITTHGTRYVGDLSQEEQHLFQAGRCVVRSPNRPGSNDCATFHPEPYVRSILARELDVVEFIPEGALGNPYQDAYLLRKPSGA
jgi:SAM-dependent methyltransferase